MTAETVEDLTSAEPWHSQDPTDSDRSAQRRYVLRRLRRSRTFVIGLGVVVFWVACALVAPSVTPYNPYKVDPLAALQAPSTSHWFGTDNLGRDVFARTLAGARPVLIIAPLATLLCLLGGAVVGLISAYMGGLVDEVSMRAVDVLLALPVIVAAMFALSLVGSSPLVVIGVIAVLFMPVVARTVRSAALTESEREYVQAATLRGERASFTMTFEILPNILSPIIVEGSIRLGYAVLTAATISFLGFGLQPPSPDWGLTVAQQQGVIQVAPWSTFFPALALGTLVVGANLAADGLRQALLRD